LPRTFLAVVASAAENRQKDDGEQQNGSTKNRGQHW